MSGITGFRCPACRELLLVSDRGCLRVVLPALLLGTSKSGEPEVRCRCGRISSWARETAKVGDG